ncbi:hypothetical protein GQ607_009886 [Colletotrichum asianum]|uniref:Uncharacterized protein n=1 Tax=Colletotrichum asianum TaxID=702518 RepID=A0A8H3ZTD8_9PEZI|nr:hypothetical protein GQ607_009886 [Colletotrichum asianum]
MGMRPGGKQHQHQHQHRHLLQHGNDHTSHAAGRRCSNQHYLLPRERTHRKHSGNNWQEPNLT